jgi:hypothetical protein
MNILEIAQYAFGDRFTSSGPVQNFVDSGKLLNELHVLEGYAFQMIDGAGTFSLADIAAQEQGFDSYIREKEHVALWHKFRMHRAKLFEAARWALDAVMNDAPGMSAEDKAAWAAWQAWWFDATADFANPGEAFANAPVPPKPIYVFD